ncbi:carboxy-S-adenosyl-L-methionine synthase CmoA [Deltaproteobacteria bacterium TL4]
MKDQIYKQTLSTIPTFKFDESVANVFEDMLARSIPLYQQLLSLTLENGIRFYQPETRIYDLGCSTGTLMEQLVCVLQRQHPQIVGVDASEAMLHKAKQKLTPFAQNATIEWICQDISQTPILNASVVIMNYTLQFVALEKRQEVLSRLFSQLNPGGVLLMSEKTQSQHPTMLAVETQSFDNYKRSNGYSELEIEQKRKALENVLHCLSPQQNLELLKNAGFPAVEIILKWYQFTTFLAIKADTS